MKYYVTIEVAVYEIEGAMDDLIRVKQSITLSSRDLAIQLGEHIADSANQIFTKARANSGKVSS